MSPQKSHEVSRLSHLVRTIALQCSDRRRTKVVDVGSGQGYLSYEMASPNDLSQGGSSVMEILALESDEHQLSVTPGEAEKASHQPRSHIFTLIYPIRSLLKPRSTIG